MSFLASSLPRRKGTFAVLPFPCYLKMEFYKQCLELDLHFYSLAVVKKIPEIEIMRKMGFFKAICLYFNCKVPHLTERQQPLLLPSFCRAHNVMGCQGKRPELPQCTLPCFFSLSVAPSVLAALILQQCLAHISAFF